jgi:hypothetical protein
MLAAGTRLRSGSEIALTRVQLAELLLAHYPDEKAEALGHLNFPIREFREMKMQPALERALKQREALDNADTDKGRPSAPCYCALSKRNLYF